jgi:hypothetical protein
MNLINISRWDQYGLLLANRRSKICKRAISKTILEMFIDFYVTFTFTFIFYFHFLFSFKMSRDFYLGLFTQVIKEKYSKITKLIIYFGSRKSAEKPKYNKLQFHQ